MTFQKMSSPFYAKESAAHVNLSTTADAAGILQHELSDRVQIFGQMEGAHFYYYPCHRCSNYHAKYPKIPDTTNASDNELFVLRTPRATNVVENEPHR